MTRFPRISVPCLQLCSQDEKNKALSIRLHVRFPLFQCTHLGSRRSIFVPFLFVFRPSDSPVSGPVIRRSLLGVLNGRVFILFSPSKSLAPDTFSPAPPRIPVGSNLLIAVCPPPSASASRLKNCQMADFILSPGSFVLLCLARRLLGAKSFSLSFCAWPPNKRPSPRLGSPAICPQARIIRQGEKESRPLFANNPQTLRGEHQQVMIPGCTVSKDFHLSV